MLGEQFDVARTSSTLELVFQKVVAGRQAPLRLGPGVVAMLMERQHDHVPSVQAFVSALQVSRYNLSIKGPCTNLNSMHICATSLRIL